MDKTNKEVETSVVSKEIVAVTQTNMVRTDSISRDCMQRLVLHNCIQHPQDNYALADFYNINAWHRKCILKKRNHICGLGYEFMNEKVDLTKIKEFCETPNQNYSFNELVKRFCEDILLYRNAYLETVITPNRVFAFHLPAKAIYVEPRMLNQYPSLEVENYWQIQSGVPDVSWRPFSGNMWENEITHYKNYNTKSSYYGVPEYVAILNTILESYYIQQYNINLYSNSCVPDLSVIVTGGKLTAKAEASIKSLMAGGLKSYQNAHRTLYLAADNPDVKIELKPLYEVRETSFRLAKNSNRDEIVAMHGVPPKLLGISSPGSLGSGSETIGSMKSYLEEELYPNKQDLEDFMNLQFFLRLFGVNPKIKFNTIDITDAKDDAEIDQRYVSMRVLSPEQIAQMRGWDFDKKYWENNTLDTGNPRNDFGKNPSLTDNFDRNENE